MVVISRFVGVEWVIVNRIGELKWRGWSMCYLDSSREMFVRLGGGEGGGEMLKDVYVYLSYFLNWKG